MDEIKGTALVRLLGLAKIPMIFYCRPSVMNINDEEMTLKIPLAKGDVHFTCRQGAEIKALVEEAARTGERQNIPLKITASVPSIEIDPVAEMVITLSIKVKE